VAVSVKRKTKQNFHRRISFVSRAAMSRSSCRARCWYSLLFWDLSTTLVIFLFLERTSCISTISRPLRLKRAINSSLWVCSQPTTVYEQSSLVRRDCGVGLMKRWIVSAAMIQKMTARNLCPGAFSVSINKGDSNDLSTGNLKVGIVNFQSRVERASLTGIQ
jgi:hypothetical protein